MILGPIHLQQEGIAFPDGGLAIEAASGASANNEATTVVQRDTAKGTVAGGSKRQHPLGTMTIQCGYILISYR